jgi:plastocyanin
VRLQRADQVKARHISVAAALAVAVGMLALTGCGSSSKSTSESTPAATTPATTAQSTSTAAPATAGALSVAANPEGQLKFETTTLTAKAGNVSVDFTNMASVSHNLTVESSSGSTVGATPTFSGESKKLTLNLKPGTYKFYCSVPGHRQAGMEGTLTVK